MKSFGTRLSIEIGMENWLKGEQLFEVVPKRDVVGN